MESQRFIIDIIEPIERLEKLVMLTNTKVFETAKMISLEYTSKELMQNKCRFIKGLNTNNHEIGKTLFLNVSAANSKPNKYCDDEPNVYQGDITLSLDGNTGLVNKSLVGFNGYLYKIVSNNYENYEIYYSLLTSENQKIIKLNETGTTIKHSPNSKNQLLIYSFKDKKILETLFIYSLRLEMALSKLIQLKQKLINLLVK